ncbi:MAG TPA: helix-turn-helix domain-containing protein [Sporichthyaceae bacterium]|jgi:excisionase family DNA binding protein|nr:helix-turn-helix domain-containing protein [Sporichthyaceae bacterium]
MEVSVAEAAARLGVSSRRVRQRIARGHLAARRVGRVWVLEEAQLGRSERVARPMSARVAWAFLDMLDGGRGEGVSQPEQSRLRKKRELLRNGDAASLLRSWLPNRADVARYVAARADLPALREDSRLVRSGLSDLRSGLAAAGFVEGYVSAGDLDALVNEYLLSQQGRPNVVLHVLGDRSLPDPVPLPVLLADLADHDGPRESAAVERLIKDLPA